MPLKNIHYNAIMRQYDRLLLLHARERDARIAQVYQAIPEYKRLDEQIAETAAAYARQAVIQPNAPRQHADDQLHQLEQQKEQLLITHNLPNYDQLWYQCPDCRDTGFIDEEKCHCFKQAMVDLVYAQSNIKERLETENFDNFSLDYYAKEVDRQLGISHREHMGVVLKQCLEFIKNFNTVHDNLLFYGDTGVGKTFLSHCIAKELLDSAHTVIYLTAFQLIDAMEAHTFGRDSDDDIADDMFSFILDCDLLVIDDLGTELNNSFTNSQLFLCLNERLLRQKSTIISTNFSLEELQTVYSERIISRIFSNYQVLPILGEDIRIKKAISS